MPYDRDVRAFHDRASTYEGGWRGRMHLDIASATADLAVGVDPTPRRVLDVGCGTGALLRLLAGRLPACEALVGIDAAPAMVDTARALADDPRIRICGGVAEHLPYPDGSFDLLVSTTSFDHWNDQRLGLQDCARVLRPGGTLVLADLFSLWLVPTGVLGRRGRARTRQSASGLLTGVGFRGLEWHRIYLQIINAVVATR